MRLKIIAICAALTIFATGCGVAGKVGSSLSGVPIEHRLPDGVRCYESQNGSISCLVVR